MYLDNKNHSKCIAYMREIVTYIDEQRDALKYNKLRHSRETIERRNSQARACGVFSIVL